MSEPLNALNEIVRHDGYARYALRADAKRHLATATALLDAADVAADARAARAAHDLLEQGLRDALRAAVLLAVAVGVLRSALDDERDALTDEEVARLVAVRVGDDPRVIRVLGVLRDELRDLDRVAGDVVLDAAVDDGGHDSPSVGRHGLVPVASAGSSAGVPATDVPTVGAPTDAPPDPSGAGASVERTSEQMVALMRLNLEALELERHLRRPARLAAQLVALGWRL